LLSKRRRQGRGGEAISGPQGAKGDDALEIVNWHVDFVKLQSCSVHD
jgi:hypothetical protein